MPGGGVGGAMKTNGVPRIDVHTHILPRHLPAFGKRFGYGEFVELRHECGCKVGQRWLRPAQCMASAWCRRRCTRATPSSGRWTTIASMRQRVSKIATETML